MSFISKLINAFKLKSPFAEESIEQSLEDKEYLEELKKKYIKLRRNCIRTQIGGKAQDESLTYFGGAPCTPKDFEWPYFETDSFDDKSKEVKPRPLAFLAQFDCRDFSENDEDNLLPHTGVLAFFYSIESYRWGYDPADEGCARVYWFENTEELKPVSFPNDLTDSYRFPKLQINLSAQDSYPDYETLPQNYDSEEYEEFFEKIHCEEDENISKLLGWADTIQAEMESECELVTNNYNVSDYSSIPESDVEKASRVAPKKWQLLFQLGTVRDDDFELTFGDEGRIYFWIRKEDLAARRFDRIWLILQCY